MPVLKGRVEARRIVIDAYVSDRDSPHNSKECRGLVDTGSPVSGIPEEWGDELGLAPIGTSPDAWRVGNSAVDLWQCRASIAIDLGSGAPSGLLRRIPVEAVMLMPFDTRPDEPKFDILIGMDVLEHYRLVVEGEMFEISGQE